jgi:hypothetical protein
VDRLPALDADFGHELLQDGLALRDRGIPHPVGDHGPDLGQLSGCRLRDVLVLDGCAQLGLSAPERPELVVQGGNSRATGVLGHGAGLERLEVAVELLVGLPDLRPNHGQLALPAGEGRSGPGQEVGHGIIDQPLILQGGQQRPLDREVELVGVDPLGRAGRLAIALLLVAGVVAVAVDLALGRRADHVVSAVGTDDEPAEVLSCAAGEPSG